VLGGGKAIQNSESETVEIEFGQQKFEKVA